MMDGLGQVAGLGKPTDEAQLIAVTTEGPDRRFLLAIGPDGPSLTDAGEGDIKATLRLPAEAFVRLLFGRLDPDHTPPVQTEGVDLDLLRQTFPGFCVCSRIVLADSRVPSLEARRNRLSLQSDLRPIASVEESTMSTQNFDDDPSVTDTTGEQTDPEEYGSLTVEDDPEGTTDPAELAGTADESDEDVS